MTKLLHSYELSISTEDESKFIGDELENFNFRQVPVTQTTTPIFKRYVIKDNNVVIAGINAIIYHWGILYIDELFVAETYREKGLGSRLLAEVENEARKIGATLAHLDSFDFQAKEFYLKNGYEVFGELENCPPKHKRYYFKKVL